MKSVSTGRDVTLLMVATIASAMASSMLATVLGLQVFAITGRELDLGLIGLAEFLPVLGLSIFTGAMADQFDRRWVFVVGLLVSVHATAGLLFFARQLNTDALPASVLPMLVLASVIGAGRALGSPASRALLFDLAPREMVERLVAIRSLLFQIALVVGPIIGALANRASATLPYKIVIGLLFVSATVVLAISSTRAVAPNNAAKNAPSKELKRQGIRQTLRDAVEGLGFIRRSPIVLGAISLDLFAVLFGGAVALLPAIVEKRLDFDDVDLGVGILRSAIAGGAALMALGLSIRPLKTSLGKWLFAVIAIFGAGTIVIGVTHSFWVAFAAIAGISAADQISVFIRSSVVPMATPESMRGRVFAVENIFIGGSNQLGAFESGVTAAWFGLAPAVVLGGIGTLAVVAVGWVVFPELVRVNRLADVEPMKAGD